MHYVTGSSVGKKLRFKVESNKSEDGQRVYSLAK